MNTLERDRPQELSWKKLFPKLREAKEKVREAIGDKHVSVVIFAKLVIFAVRQTLGQVKVVGPNTVLTFKDDFTWKGSGGSDYYSQLNIWHNGASLEKLYHWRDGESRSYDRPELGITDITDISVEGCMIHMRLVGRNGYSCRTSVTVSKDSFQKALEQFDPCIHHPTDFSAAARVAGSALRTTSKPDKMVLILEKGLGLLEGQVRWSRKLPYGGMFAEHYIGNGARDLLDLIRKVYNELPDGQEKKLVAKVFEKVSDHNHLCQGRFVSVAPLE